MRISKNVGGITNGPEQDAGTKPLNFAPAGLNAKEVPYQALFGGRNHGHGWTNFVDHIDSRFFNSKRGSV